MYEKRIFIRTFIIRDFIFNFSNKPRDSDNPFSRDTRACVTTSKHHLPNCVPYCTNPTSERNINITFAIPIPSIPIQNEMLMCLVFLREHSNLTSRTFW